MQFIGSVDGDVGWSNGIWTSSIMDAENWKKLKKEGDGIWMASAGSFGE